jgi:hypothetical protein
MDLNVEVREFRVGRHGQWGGWSSVPLRPGESETEAEAEHKKGNQCSEHAKIPFATDTKSILGDGTCPSNFGYVLLAVGNSWQAAIPQGSCASNGKATLVMSLQAAAGFAQRPQVNTIGQPVLNQEKTVALRQSGNRPGFPSDAPGVPLIDDAAIASA